MAVAKEYYELENQLRIEYGLNEWHNAPDNHPVMKKMKQIIMVCSRSAHEDKKAKEERIRKLSKPRFWTEERVEYLRINYLNETDEEIGKKLGTTAGAVKSKRLDFKLSRMVNGVTKNAMPIVYVDDKRRENKFSSRSQLCRYLGINNYQLDKLIEKGERCWYA